MRPDATFSGIRILGLLAVLLVAATLRVSAAPAPPPVQTIASDRLGQVPYALPAGKPLDVVILFSDKPSERETADAVQRLTGLGAAVVIVDSGAYYRSLVADKAACAWLSSDMEDLNRALQRKLQFQDFRVPVLASIGSGGGLVYGLLAEAPSYSFAGGASVRFSQRLPQPLDICGVGQAENDRTLMPAVDVQQPWKVEPAPGDDGIADWIDRIAKAELVQQTSAPPADRLADMVKPLLAMAINKDPNSIDDLPVIEMPTGGAVPGKAAPYVAIVYSGDGGWRDLDRTLGQVLSAHGVPVVGVDSLLYFWQPKRPEIVAYDLNRIIDHYRRVWHIDHFVLVGYSFGADILPFAYNRLPAENKARIGEVSLLALSRNTRFGISVSEYFSDHANAETLPVEPELAKMPAKLIQCFYGEDEADDSACTTGAAKGEEIVETAGGHHFGDDYEALATRIIDGAARRLGR